MRKKRVLKKRLIQDPRYNDFSVERFINCIMESGKKNTARKLLYTAMDVIAERTKAEPLEIFKKAVQNAAPVIEVRSRRVGGATYQVPVEVREARRLALAIRFLKKYASDRKDKSMSYRLAAELIAASNGEGGAVKRRDEIHRMAEANKAFAHFKW
jgi:small subunit ribosomal protein S7